jgi:hypothetical protein
MKCIFIFSLLTTPFLSFSQQYERLELEKFKVDKNNLIYKVNNQFIFDYEIIINNDTMMLLKNTIDSFELVHKSSDLIFIKQINCDIVKSTIFSRVNKNQTNIIYSYVPTNGYGHTTGLVENEKNTWIHPVRSGFFKSLETCPFPYYKNLPDSINEWTDSMSIGSSWSNKIWGEWQNRLVLKYTYVFLNNEKINTPFGLLDCKIIDSRAESKIGISYLKMYYSEKYGFVKMDYVLATGIKINLTLTALKSFN